MTTSLTFAWWMVPLIITIIAWLPAAFHRPSGTYDFRGAIWLFVGVVVTAAAWLVAIALRHMA
ncbi:MAG: hypothetical protein AAGM84_05520 [Pseudomonadota bacterium]